MARELLSDDSLSDSDNAGGATIKINEDYATRFVHNKKREELQRLEDKHGNSSRKRKRDGRAESDSDLSSSTSEDEDSEGEFATAALDNEIQATLNAIKSKDPRVYNTDVTFYTEFDENVPATKEKKDKPIYLQDYHRQNLLNGVTENGQNEAEAPLTYNQQQEQLKRSVVGEIHAAGADSNDDSDADSEGGFLVRKSKPDRSVKKQKTTLDVVNADKDPETFLSNFMAARAWVPTDRSQQHAFESDDEEEDKRAEEFEEAYNMRFEAPEKSNEVLRTYGREAATKYSVRRDEQNPRQKRRDAERAAKEAARQERREEKQRLKKLRMEEVEEKVKRIKRAAGLKTEDLQPEDWQRFIDDEWDDERWEEEMQRRFGDQYYADKDALSSEEAVEDDETETTKKKRKVQKPEFDDDIDIKDIVPDFISEEEAEFSLTDEEEEDDGSKQKKKKTHKQVKQEKQKQSKKERRIIEQLVDDQLQMDLDHALPTTSRSKSSGFRYRETSPTSFGLTARDILLADDAALNQFAGLKKLGSFRDPERKQKDKKHLGKKARLRKWRLDTFGDEEGLETTELVPELRTNGASGPKDESDAEDGGVNIIEKGEKKKQKRRRGKKAKRDLQPQEV